MERRGDSAGRRARAAIGQMSRAPAGGAGLPAAPIPQNPSDLATAQAFNGAPAVPRTVSAPVVPQNPFMAPNGRSNLHDDASMTNTYTWSAPLGNAMQVLSTF